MDTNILSSSQGENGNGTPLGTNPINPNTGLSDGKKFKIDANKLQNAKALSRKDVLGRVYTEDVVIPKSVYRILGDDYHPEFDPEYNAILLSRKQTNAGKFVAALNQAVLGEIVGGTMEGLSYLLDIPMMVDMLEGTEQEFGNALTDFAKGIRDWTKEVTPVFTDPTAKKFNPLSWEWWMKNAPSIASSVSLALPAIGGMKALSAVGSLVGATQKLGKLGKYSKLFSTAFGQAVMSRHMENLMEANGDYQQNYEDAKQKLYQKYKGQIEEEIKSLPLFTPVDEEFGVKPGQYTKDQYNKDINHIRNKWEDTISNEARQLAASAAVNTYGKNWVMLLQDIPEYMLLGRLIKPGAKSIAKGATENSAKVAKRLGMNMPKFYTSKTAKHIGNMLGEGVEENYQFLVNDQSARMIRNMATGERDSLLEVFKDNYDNGELWTNTFFGAIGAGAMQASMAGLNAKAFSELSKKRVENINMGSTLMNKLCSDYVAAEELGDEALKKAAVQEFVSAVGIKSIELGNKEHLLNMIDALASGDENVLQNYEMSSDTREFIKTKPDIADEIKNSIESIDKKYKDSMSELESRGIETKAAIPIVRMMAHANHILEYLNNESNIAKQKLSGIEVAGYTKPTVENEMLSDEGKIIFSSRHERAAIKKRIDQVNKQLKKEDLSDTEKAKLEKEKDRLVSRTKQLDKDVKEIVSKLNDVDKKLLGSATKKNGTIPASDVENYLNTVDEVQAYESGIESYKTELDIARKLADQLSKESGETKKPTKPVDDGKLFKGSLVSFKDPETEELKPGIVEDIEYAENEGVPLSEHAKNLITVKSLKDGENGKLYHVYGISVTPISKEEVEKFNEGLAEDDTDDWDQWIESNYQDASNKKDEYRRKSYKPRQIGKESEKGLMEFVSYTHYEELTPEDKKEGKVPKLIIDNQKFDTFISNPENKKYLDSSVAEYSIDKKNEYFKNIISKWKEDRKIPINVIELLEGYLDGKRLNKNDIKLLLSYVDIIGELPISIKITSNGKIFEGGMYLFTLQRNLKSLTNNELHKSYKDMRKILLDMLLSGKPAYTKGLSTNRGVPNNITKDVSQKRRYNSISEVFDIKSKDAKLYISKSSTRQAKNVRSDDSKPIKGEYEEPMLMASMSDSQPIVGDFSSTGSIHLLTEKTVNGQPYAVKLNKSFLSKDHAMILFNAFSSLAKTEVVSEGEFKRKAESRDRVGLYSAKVNPKVKDEQNEGVVWNLSAGELTDLLVVHGEELTDPDSSRYSNVNELNRMSDVHKLALKSQRLFLKRGYDNKGRVNAIHLCYGITKEQYPINTSVPGETKMVDYNRIDLTSPAKDDTFSDKVIDFVKWATTTKKYAVHLENRTLDQKLNGSFLQGKSFRIGKKGLKVEPSELARKRYVYSTESELIRKQGESYTEFLLNNNMLTTDLERTKDGLLFGSPFVHLGFDRTKNNFGIQTGEVDKADTKIESKVVEEEAKVEEEDIKEAKPKRKTVKVVKKDRVKDILDGDNVNLRERKQSIRKLYDKQDLEKELYWIRKKLNIKDKNIEVEKRLSKMMLDGKKAWAIYTHSLITIYEAAEEGTLYHEAFHRASLGYLSRVERESFYRSARQLYNMSKEEFSDNQVEEKLAEEFRIFVLSKQKESQPSIIKRMFKAIYDFVQALFFGRTRLTHGDVQRLFNQIYSGRYRFSRVKRENIDTPARLRELMGHEYNSITSYKDVSDITKYLAKKLLSVNKVENINDIRRIKWTPLINNLENIIDQLQELISDVNTDEFESNRALKVHTILKDILGEKNDNGEYEKFWVFRYNITKFLHSMNILSGSRNTENDEIFESDSYYDNSEDFEKSNKIGKFGEVDYFKPLKDNALASVKFVINTLHESEDVNESIGLVGYVNGNKVWGKLLNDIIKFNNVFDMIDEIRRIGEVDEYYPYVELANILESSTENFRTQFQITFETHKHKFINSSFIKRSNEGGFRIDFDDASHDELRRGVANKWSEFIFYDKDIISIESDEENKNIKDKKVNSEFFKKLAKQYRKEVVEYYEDKSKDGKKELSDEELEELFKNISMILSNIHIDVSTDVIRRYIYNIDEKRSLQENLYNGIDELMNVVSVEVIYDGNDFRSASKDPNVLELANAYAEVNSHEEVGMVLGPDGNSFYKYARLNHATDIVRKIKRGPKWASDKLSRVYNKHSRIINSFVPKDDSMDSVREADLAREKFELVTMSSFKSRSRFDTGREYLKMNTIEDYLMKSGAILTGGLLPFPIMANRKTYYFIDGVDLVGIKDDEGNNINVISKSNPDGTVKFTDEVLDIFYGYYLDEKERVDVAIKFRKEYEDEKKHLVELKKQPNVDISSIDKQLKNLKRRWIKNYHYAGNYDLTRGNAYHFIHFKGLENIKDPVTAREKINNILNDRLKDEINFASKYEILNYSKDGDELKLYSNMLDDDIVSSFRILDDQPQNFAILSVLSKIMINTQIGVIESEKMFLADPAMFKRNKKGAVSESEFDVYEDLYKRWFGVGSTGTKLRHNIPNRPTTYNVSIFNTQKFKYSGLDVLIDKHAELYEDIISDKYTKSELKKSDIQEEIKKEARVLAEMRLKKYNNVDPTDGTAYISPEMFKEIIDRLGLWDDRKQKAYDLLQSNKSLSTEEIVSSSNIIFNPLKTVYIGNHDFNGVDLLIYNKMAMFTLFRQIVKNTPLSDVLDRMEGVGKYEGLNKIHVYNFDSAVKVGTLSGVNMFENPNKREVVTDLSESFVFEQSFENLTHQQVVEPHDSSKQNFGTAGIKIGWSDIIMDKPYGEFKTGKDLLEAVTEARVAISNFGVHKINAKFGIFKGKISNGVFVEMIRQHAESANKSRDFIEALKIDDNGNKYLELDSFHNRKWIYSTIKTIVDDYTINLSTPGNQLVQMSDFGMSSDSEASYRKNLTMTRSYPGETKIYEIECRVSSRMFASFFPQDHVVTKQDIQKLIGDGTFIFGYRVPTQGQGSIFKLKVVDVLPEQAGDIIQLPLEFTALTGSDFDIDKLYVAMYNYEHEYEGDKFVGLKKIEFLDDTNSNIKDRYRNKVIELFNIYKNSSKVFGDLIVEKDGKKIPIVSKYFYEDYILNKGKRSNIEERISKINDQFEDELTMLQVRRDELLRKLDSPQSKSFENGLKITLDATNSRIEEIQSYILNFPLQSNMRSILVETDFIILRDYLVKLGLLPTLEEFGKLSMAEQNNNEANSNRILDGLFTVLSDEKHFINMTTPLGSMTDILENKSEWYDRVYSKKHFGNVPALYTTTPSFQAQTKEKFSSSVYGIAPYALNNNHHMLTQMAQVSMLSDIDFGFNKKGEISLHEIIGNDNVYITGWISALIDIHVDGVNKPTSAPLNINEYTHDVINFMVRSGVGETTFDFIAQPSVKDYSLNMSKSYAGSQQGRSIYSVDSDDAFEYTLDFYRSVILENKYYTEDELYQDNFIIPLKDLLNIKQLQEDAKFYVDRSKRDKEWYRRQISILVNFKQLQEDATLLSNFVLSSRVDTGKYGSNPIEILHFIKSIENVISNGRFTNVEKVLTYNRDYKYTKGDTFLPQLIKNSMFKIFEILRFESLYSSIGFNNILNEIVHSSSQGNFNRLKYINILSDELITYFMGKFFADPVNGFGMTFMKLVNMIFLDKNNNYERLVQLKAGTHKLSDKVKNNAFLDSIVVDYSDNILKDLDDNPLGYTYIKPLYRSLREDLDNEELVEGFKDIIYSDEKELRDLGLFLYLYSFYTSAFRNKRFSYASWMPLALNREIEYDGRIVSLDNYIKGLLRKLNEDNGYLEFLQDAKRDVFLNTIDSGNIIQTIDNTIIATTFKSKDFGRFAIRIDYERANKTLWTGKNSSKNNLFVSHIKNIETGEVYEYVGYDISSNDPYYVVVSSKGFGNKGIMLHEYGIKRDDNPNIIRSVLKVNNRNDLQEPLNKVVERLYKMLNDKEKNTFRAVPFEEQILTESADYRTNFIDTEDGAAAMRDQEKKDIIEELENKEAFIKTKSVVSLRDVDQQLINKYNESLKQSVANKTGVLKPLFVDIDGSAKGFTKDEPTVFGGGAYGKLNGKEYFLRVSDKTIRDWFKNKGVPISDKANNELAELFTLLGVLDTFKNTSEHLFIYQDYNGALMYFLKNAVNPQEAFPNSPKKEWKMPTNRPDLTLVINLIRDRIKRIEDNEGSVNIKWVRNKSTGSAKLVDKLAKGEHEIVDTRNDFRKEEWGTALPKVATSRTSLYRTIKKIISGGQTGADEGGLEVADEKGLDFGGTASYGYNQNFPGEFGKNINKPNFILRDYYKMIEGELRIREGSRGKWEDVYSHRTEQNVINSNGTVWFGLTGASESRGYEATKKAADKAKKPFLENPTAEQLADWIVENKVEVLNVAGNREHLNQGIKVQTKRTLKQALELLKKSDEELNEERVPRINSKDTEDGIEQRNNCKK